MVKLEIVHKNIYVCIGTANVPCRIYEPKDSANLRGIAVEVLLGLSGCMDKDLESNHPWLNNNTDAIARSLAEYGFLALEFNPPGHDGFGVPFSIDNYVDISKHIAEFLRNAYRFDDVCGFGHSLGAVVCAMSASEAHVPYKAVSLLSTPIHIKEAMDKWKMPSLYSLVQGTPLEEPACKAGLIMTDNFLLHFQGMRRLKPNALAHLSVDSASGFVKELINAKSLDEITIPEQTGVLVAYAERDGLMYGELKPELKEHLKERWHNIAQHSRMLTYPADHNFTNKDRPGMVLTAPEFDDVIRESVELFSS